MVDSNEPSAPAAATAAASTTRVRVPGRIAAAPADRDQPSAVDAASRAPEHQDADPSSLDELISRERRRHAETRAAMEPLTDAAGARVCCVLCLTATPG